MTTLNISQTSNIDEACSICLSPLTQRDLDVFTTTCRHKFHFQCLTKHIRAKNNQCPLCGTRLNSLVNILNCSSTITTTTTNKTPLAIRNVPIQEVASIQTIPSTNRKNTWTKLTKSLSNVFRLARPTSRISNSSGTSNASSISRPPINSNNRSFRPNFSNQNSSAEDLIDEKAVRALSARIQAARQQYQAGDHESPLITLTTTLEFGGQESTKESNIYGMVTLKAPSIFSNIANEKEIDELHVPIDLVCVVDQSISMLKVKMPLLKETLNYIVDQMGPLDRLSIISFNTQAFDRSNGLKLMTLENKQAIRNAITNEISAVGGTLIGSGLTIAIEQLRNRRTTNPLGAILLLTDGQDNLPHDYTSLIEFLPEDVTCHSFGYGPDHNASLLSQLAEQGHEGTFTYIDQVDAIGSSFGTVLGGLFTCIAKQLCVKLEFDQDYKITHTHTTYKYKSKDLPSEQLTFNMTDLNADENRNLVFQLSVPIIKSLDENNANNNIIGHASLQYIDTYSNQIIHTPSVPFILSRPNQVDPQSSLLQINHTLDVQRNRAETSQILKRAVEAHDYTHAHEIIKNQIEKIRSSLSAQDPLCQQLIYDLEQQYSNQREFKTIMTNMYRQHGQERATYSTNKTTSAAHYMTSGQERLKMKFVK
ncbi:unnamed protein product [Adineta steineri]|uniref:Uncharacterized protein n=3 Tax=Adineta steineri TaxID=433720 RepID=A0A815I3S1_9BILA|nr:unnamed protein product [Adineta steineri]CAF1362466.1 unnamed protein product [Adineta steineri]CAF3615763.1 unnamed protein product [Adineta steineri]